jgi:hypothetical protein
MSTSLHQRSILLRQFLSEYPTSLYTKMNESAVIQVPRHAHRRCRKIPNWQLRSKGYEFCVSSVPWAYEATLQQEKSDGSGIFLERSSHT